MNRFSAAGALLLLAAGVAAAADKDKGRPAPAKDDKGAPVGAAGKEAPAAPRAAPETLTAWEWYADVRLPAADKPPRWADFLLTPGVLDKARPDQADLRLYDARGRTVPYALRIRRPRDEQQPLFAREFNRATNPDRSVELRLDLGERPPEHNEVEVVTRGDDFRRRLEVEGSDDGNTWSKLLDKAYLVHFRAGDKTMDVRKAAYPPSRFRYLRLRVFPDRGLADDAPAVASATVLHTVRVAGEDVTAPANLGPRQADPGDGGPGSVWPIDFGGDAVPVERLTFDVADKEFVRPFRLEAVDADGARTFLASGQWQRTLGDERPLEIKFGEVTARRLRLVVTDFRNQPLDVRAVTYSAPARQVVFEPKPELAQPLRLYFGNPNAGAPHYDFAATLPTTLNPAPERDSLEGLTRNPEYRPPPKPWTERWPWLVYLVLGPAAAVLLAILGALGREAVRRHDAAASVNTTR
jgi:hypothetical protein